jgi:hypothetical protein
MEKGLKICSRKRTTMLEEKNFVFLNLPNKFYFPSNLFFCRSLKVVPFKKAMCQKRATLA